MDNSHLFAALPHLPPERRWRQQYRPVWGVTTLIQRTEIGEERFLLINRRQPPYAGKWALVGGKVDFGETLAAAAVREVKEETNLNATFIALRGIVNERLAPAGPEDEAGHFLLFVCAVSAPDGQASEQAEGKLAWFTKGDIERLHDERLIIPSDFVMIDLFGASDQCLPYYEAEMIAAQAGNADALSAPHLNRFSCME